MKLILVGIIFLITASNGFSADELVNLSDIKVGIEKELELRGIHPENIQMEKSGFDLYQLGSKIVSADPIQTYTFDYENQNGLFKTFHHCAFDVRPKSRTFKIQGCTMSIEHFDDSVSGKY